MNQQNDKSLERRIRELETSLTDVRRALDYLLSISDHAVTPDPAPIPEPAKTPEIQESVVEPAQSAATADPPPEPEQALARESDALAQRHSSQTAMEQAQEFSTPAGPSVSIEKFLKSEFLLNKLGIGLLLFGVVFLFKYSIDQGWITPAVRVACGLALGVALLGFGSKLYSRRHHFSLVLLGGAMATFYISIFSAFQMYQLISHPTAFAAMCAVTILALALALNKNDMILSLIGTIGGLGTPFFLYTGEGNIPGLVTYTCTLLFGTLAIYFLKGWRPLLAVSVIGGWMVMMSAISALSLGENATAPNQWAIQAGLLFAFLAFWLTPVSREVVGALKGGNYEASSAHPLAHFSAISAPIVALGLSIVLWEITNTMTRESWGIVAFTVSALYGLAGWRLYRWPQTYKLAYTHSLLAGFFFTLALALILEGDMLLISLATEAALLSFVSRKLSDLGVRIAGHILATIVLFWLAARVFLVYPEPELISSHALSDLWVILMGLVISQVYRSKLDSSVYLIGAAGALAAWLARGLEGNVEFLALIVEAIGLHLAARYRKNENIEISAHIFFVCLALLEFTRLFTFNSEGLPLVNWLAATDLFFIVTVIAVGFYLQAIEERRMYWLAGAAALAGLFIRELNSHWTLVAHALEATALSALARHYSDKALRGGSHALFGILAYYFVERLVTVTASGFPLFNGPGIADLTALAAALFVSLRYYSSQVRVVYQLGVHLGFLALVLREFIELENGHGYISAIWGVYAITLLVVGFRRANNTLRLTAMGTLLLVIGKLFLIDLANLETIWRILLFLSFGGILLGVSYYFQTLWKAPDTNSQAISKTEDTHQAN